MGQSISHLYSSADKKLLFSFVVGFAGNDVLILVLLDTVRGVSEQTRPNVAPVSSKSCYEKNYEKEVMIKYFFHVIMLTRFEPFLGPLSNDLLEN